MHVPCQSSNGLDARTARPQPSPYTGGAVPTPVWFARFCKLRSFDLAMGRQFSLFMQPVAIRLLAEWNARPAPQAASAESKPARYQIIMM